MSGTTNQTNVIDQFNSNVGPKVPHTIDEESPGPVKVNDLNVDVDQEASPSKPNDQNTTRKLQDPTSKPEIKAEAPSAVSEKSQDGGSNKGCLTVGGILGVLMLAGAILMAVFWIQTRQENAELRKRLAAAVEAEAEADKEPVSVPVCQEVEALKQKFAVMSAQVANNFATPSNQIVKNYDMDTYPMFSTMYRDEYLKKLQLKSYLVFNTVGTFFYDDAESECQNCEYRIPEQLSDGAIYIGQWKNEQKFGRGTEILVDGTVRQGYYEDGMFVGKRREITASGTTKEWMADGEYLETEYQCWRKSLKCAVKPKKNAFIPMDFDEAEDGVF